MELLEIIKKNAEQFASIPNAAEVIGNVKTKLQELGYTTFVDSTKEPTYVDKARFDQVNTQTGELNKQLEELKKAAKGNEELTKTIEDLQKKNSDWESKYKDSMLTNAVKLAATKAGAKDAADILALVDKTKLTLKDDNTVDGLDDMLKSFKESKGYLFGEGVKVDPANPAGDTKTENQQAANDFATGLKGF